MADPGYFSRCVAECIRHFAPQLAWSAGGRAEHRIQRACSAVEAMRLTRRRGLGKLAWNGKRGDLDVGRQIGENPSLCVAAVSLRPTRKFGTFVGITCRRAVTDKCRSKVW
jgi:hypothetical protein